MSLPAFLPNERPVWERDGRDWPNREASRFVNAAGLRWHVQRMGAGPVALLVHGTGAATHSWRGLMPILAERFDTLAPDLPGHGFTEHPGAARLSLPGMARDLDRLLETLGVAPDLVIGHSAGAAILARMALDGAIAPRLIVAINGAFRPFGGAAASLFSPMAKLLTLNPLAPRVFAWRASDRAAVERLIRNTGSVPDPVGTTCYGRLVRRPAHVSAALGMMANWELRDLERDLTRLPVPLLLIAGGNDRAIPPGDAGTIRARVKGATLVDLPGLGHLAHEEDPRAVADAILAAYDRRAA
ncbi:MAG: alpha/beta fold hydrolase [Azospirillaceae bacterium]